MLRQWDARTFEGVAGDGRTRPMILGCVRKEGSRTLRASFVVKCEGLPEMTVLGLLNEAFGHATAQAVGVYTPQVALIIISPAFADQANRALAEQGLPHRIEPGIGVGCELARGIGQIGRDPVLRGGELMDAANIYGLDLLIQNPDRISERPNCGLHSGRVLAYDFDQAFSFRFLLGAPRDPCAVSTHGISKNHLFYRLLRGVPIDWTSFVAGVGTLSQSWLDGVCDALPSEWHDSAKPLCEHLSAVNARAGDFGRELLRSLE